jgi:probable rRNA maturation factor
VISFYDAVEWNNNLDYQVLQTQISTIISDYNKVLDAINFIFCSDDYLLDINQKFLSHDYYTDVITFDYDDEVVLSDVYISIERVQDNALNNGCDFLNELHRVMYHAVLHLCGLGDKTNEEAVLMRQKEDYYLSLLVSRET